MRTYRPTGLSLAAKHCPRALDHFEQGTPYDRRQFETGNAAHAILQALGEHARETGAVPDVESREVLTLADRVAHSLIAHGRVYEGQPEPPMSPDTVYAGRALALDCIAAYPLSPTAQYEVALGVDAGRRPILYQSDACRLRAIHDCVDLGDDEDEESSVRTLTLRDYKSAWSTNEDELRTIQRKVQAVTAWAHYSEGVDILRLEVINLHTLKRYSQEYVAEDGLAGLLDSWWADVVHVMDAYDRQAAIGRRPAVPGAGCAGCPFLERCEDALDYLERATLHRTAAEKARCYAVACAVKDGLGDWLKAVTDESPIEIDGALVGTVGKEQRSLSDTAYSALADEWELSGGNIAGFAKACDLSVGNAEKVCRILFPGGSDKMERDRFLDSLTQPKIVRKFGVHPKPSSDRKETSDATAAAV